MSWLNRCNPFLHDAYIFLEPEQMAEIRALSDYEASLSISMRLSDIQQRVARASSDKAMV